jgi:acetate---CoA ligase (ADP-forming)
VGESSAVKTTIASAAAPEGGGRHRLAPLLAPRSLALVGASPKPDSVGQGMIAGAAGFPGRLHLVNPAYREIGGVPCYPSLAALPEPVEHVVLGVANARLEAALGEAVAAGAGAATIFGSCYLPDDEEPPLTRRLATLAQRAGMAVCGGNGMGFYNLDAGVKVCGFPPQYALRPGGVSLIAHSGSVFQALANYDGRFGWNLAVSAGQELVTTVADYLDFALDQPTTRAVGLFLETVRDPAGFIAALEKAAARDIPVVVLKVGRTVESARLAVSHSGAVAGNHAAYRALFDRHGVIETETLDAFANTLQLLGQPRRPAQGGLASIHDSGGERELLVDLAVAAKVSFAAIGPATVATLSARLEYGLDPVNPLDAWGTGRDYEGIFADCLAALAADGDTALAAFCVEIYEGYYLSEGYARALLSAAGTTEKPVVLATNIAAHGSDPLQARLAAAGIPVLHGADAALTAIAATLAHRDWRGRPASIAPPPPTGVREAWRERLVRGGPLDEAESLALCAAYGVPTLPWRIVEDGQGAVAAARELGFPAVLKTAAPGILHKTEHDGVRLGLGDATAVLSAYADLAKRLGPRVLVTRMAGKGVEIAFGASRDPQFGPLVMVGAGGVLIESLADHQFALPPFDAATARRLLDRLALRPLLDGKRGTRPADVAGLADALARFSVLVADLADLVEEIDVNPLVASPEGPLALDALVVPRAIGG